ncbi:hypothetical protein TNCV_2704691 [Trichonephila clavipes]|nr:hypothetical protein TNCV_2704691 [Trichonephila clavipes]
MRSTKDQLVEKDVLMPVKHNVFLWNLPDVEEVPSHDGETILLWSPWKYRCGQRTVRMAVVACSQNQAVFARRRIKVKAELKLKKAETLEKKLLDIRERKENARDRIRSKTRVIRGYAKSLCDELEISFEPPRRIRRKHIFGDGSKDVQLSYEDDLRRTMFLQ